MRYLAAIPLVLLFSILDVILILSLIGILMVDDRGIYPISYKFAKEVWSNGS